MKQMTVFFFLFISFLVLAPNPLAARNAGLVNPSPEPEPEPELDSVSASASEPEPEPEEQNKSKRGHLFGGGAGVLGGAGAGAGVLGGRGAGAGAGVLGGGGAGILGGGSQVRGRSRRPAIEKVCQLAKDDKLCVGSLEKDPDLDKDDSKSLAFEIIKLALSNVTAISQNVQKLATNTKLSPGLQKGMFDCQHQFVGVVNQLDDCLNALSKGNVIIVGKWLRDAVSAADTCIDSLQGVEQVLSKNIQTFRRLCENALAISKALANNPALKV